MASNSSSYNRVRGSGARIRGRGRTTTTSSVSGGSSLLPGPLDPFQPLPYEGLSQIDVLRQSSEASLQASLPPTYSNLSNTETTYNQPFPPLLQASGTSAPVLYNQPALPPLPQVSPVDDRLRAAAQMIQMPGQTTDVLTQHQQRHGAPKPPSQDRLRSFGDSLYSRAYSSRTSSRTVSRQSSAYSAYTDELTRTRAPRGTHKKSLDDSCLGWYEEDVQEVLKEARVMVVYEMVHHKGWPVILNSGSARAVWKLAIREVIAQANIKFGADVKPTKGIETLLLRTLTNVRSDAAEAAQKYAEELLKLNDPSLLANPEQYRQWKEGEVTRVTNVAGRAFFLHEYNDQGAVIRWFGNAVLERFHTTFWYTHALSPIKHLEDHFQTTPLRMYSISAVALLCALHREVNRVEGLRLQQPAFTGKEYAPLCEDYYEGMVDALNNAAIGPTFRSRLDWLHLRGLEVSKTAIHMLASPRKQRTKIFIPPAEDVAAYEAGPSFIPQPGPSSFVPQPGPSSFVPQPGPSSFLPQPGPSFVSQSAPSFVSGPGPSSEASTYRDGAAEYVWSEDQW